MINNKQEQNLIIIKLLKPTTKIVHNDIIHSSHTDEYYINLLE